MRRSVPESCRLEQGAGSSDVSLRIPRNGPFGTPKGDFTASRKRLSSADSVPHCGCSQDNPGMSTAEQWRPG